MTNNTNNIENNANVNDDKAINVSTSDNNHASLNTETKNSQTNTTTHKDKEHHSRGPRKSLSKNQDFQVEVIKIKKICKVVKGGRRFRFSALVVSGNKKGKVGYGLAKAYEVPDAIKKAQKQANKNMFNVSIVGKQNTIAHEIIGTSGASKILIKPAKEGIGIVAGGSIRILIELSGIKNIYTKSLGSRSELNMIVATINGLKNLRTSDQIAKLRDKDVKEIER